MTKNYQNLWNIKAQGRRKNGGEGIGVDKKYILVHPSGDGYFDDYHVCNMSQDHYYHSYERQQGPPITKTYTHLPAAATGFSLWVCETPVNLCLFFFLPLSRQNGETSQILPASDF